MNRVYRGFLFNVIPAGYHAHHRNGMTFIGPDYDELCREIDKYYVNERLKENVRHHND